MEKESLELKNRRIKNAVETLCEDWGRRDLFSGVCMVKMPRHDGICLGATRWNLRRMRYEPF